MIDLDGDLYVSEESVLAEQLDETPPGVELARLLASVDRSQLDCDELLRLAAARQRQIGHDEAQMLADLHAVARAVPAEQRPVQAMPRDRGLYPFAEIETAMVLRWTHGRAAHQMVLADEVIDRMPQLYTALDAGRIDIPKVLVITSLLMSVDTGLAQALVDKVIDKASEWTSAELRQRLRRLLMAADPDAVAKKARRGVKDRHVSSYLDDDTHLAHLSGRQLPPHRVAAVIERLDAVAKAAKAAGDERSVDQLRADCFMDLLTGEGIAAGGLITDGALGLDQTSSTEAAQAAAAQAVQAPWPTEPPPEAEDLATEADLATPDTAADTNLDAAPAPGTDGPLWGDLFGLRPPEDDDALDPAEPDTAAERARWLAVFDKLSPIRPATWCVLCGRLTGSVSQPGPMPGPRRGVVELVGTIDTAMGLADLPAELSGLGPVPADIARQVIAQRRDAEWRFSPV